MNEILTKVQSDLNKLQKTLEHEGEVLMSKIKDAANKAASNKNVVAKRKEFEKMVESQFKKFEPALDKFYKDLKVTAKKYGVNLEKFEKSVKSTKEKATSRIKKKKISGKTDSRGKESNKEAANSRSTAKKSPAAGRKKTTKKV